MTDTPEAEAPTIGQKVAAEIIGTFGLVFFAVGSAVFSQTLGQDSYVGVALAFGLSIIAFGYAFGRVSGAHFNPAVSIGAAMGGRISWSTAGIYSLAQIVGGLLGGGLICLIMFGFDGYSFGDFPLGANSFGDEGSGIAMWAALLVEFIATLAFVWVILGVTDERARATTTNAVLAIGFTLTLIHLALIGLTGTSVNPARSIGVAFFSGEDAIIQLWVFVLAPVLGGIVAGLTYPVLFGRDADPVPGSGMNFSSGPKAPQQFAGGYPQQQWGQPGQQQQYWNQPGQHPGAQQQWGQQPPAAAPQPPAQQWGAPEQAQPQAPEQQQYWSQPGQQPSAPEQQAWGQPAQGAAPQQWGQPAAGDDEGHTQIRRND